MFYRWLEESPWICSEHEMESGMGHLFRSTSGSCYLEFKGSLWKVFSSITSPIYFEEQAYFLQLFDTTQKGVACIGILNMVATFFVLESQHQREMSLVEQCLVHDIIYVINRHLDSNVKTVLQPICCAAYEVNTI